MARLDWRRTSIKLLSVFVALVLWAYVTNEENPINEQVFIVALQANGLPDQMVTGELPASVSVRVKGTRGQLSGLTSQDFRATANLSGVSAGENEIPVAVSVPPGVTVVNFNPQRLLVMADRVVDKTVPVQVSTKGLPARSWAAEAAVAEPSAVTVRGPQKVLNEINRMDVVVDIQSAAADIEQNVNLQSPRQGVTVDPRTVKVLVPIRQMPSKNVAVKSRLSGLPAEGHRVGNITLVPDEAQVFAPAERLEQISQVLTETVDVSGIRSTLTREVNLTEPAGVSQLSPASVRITVEIEPVAEEEEPPSQPDDPPPAGGAEGSGRTEPR